MLDIRIRRNIEAAAGLRPEDVVELTERATRATFYTDRLTDEPLIGAALDAAQFTATFVGEHTPPVTQYRLGEKGRGIPVPAFRRRAQAKRRAGSECWDISDPITVQFLMRPLYDRYASTSPTLRTSTSGANGF